FLIRATFFKYFIRIYIIIYIILLSSRTKGLLTSSYYLSLLK
ncbi:uncharacterized protein CLUP02_01833, partial [Colletotrichum lupini]